MRYADVLTLRLGQPGDVPAAVSVLAAGEAARRGDAVLDHERRQIEDRVRSRAAWCALADDAGEVVGAAVIYDVPAADESADPMARWCHLAMLCVAPGHWGRGIGAGLLDCVLAQARARGYARIQLWTQEDNERARRLYGTRGFVRTDRTKDDDRGHPIALWDKPL